MEVSFNNTNCGWKESYSDSAFVIDHSALSASKITSKVDAAAGKKPSSNGVVLPGVSMANGPVQRDVPMPDAVTNGVPAAKRKARDSLQKPKYAEPESSDDDDIPLVCSISIV